MDEERTESFVQYNTIQLIDFSSSTTTLSLNHFCTNVYGQGDHFSGNVKFPNKNLHDDIISSKILVSLKKPDQLCKNQ